MIIYSKVVSDGKKIKFRYVDSDDFNNLPYEKCRQVYGICFCKDELVIARNKDGHWSLVGGTIEKGESFEETLRREIAEESNMRILKFAPIGYQEVEIENEGETFYQLRYSCLVEPIGEFENDPAGSVVEIKLIDPVDYKKYFDWKEIGDRLVKRALELKELL